jgi:hypothetical protein
VPETPSDFSHLPILAELREELAAAAQREDAPAPSPGGVRRWLSSRVHAVAVATALVLTGGAIAAAATGVLEGSPVPEPQGQPTPNAGSGVPTAGGSDLLALRVADPEGGLPWGMRLVHTTRGQLCTQIGRVKGEQLGLLGIDGSFHDDGHFHRIAPDTLPNYTDGYANIDCILPGEIMIASTPEQERSAALLNPLYSRPIPRNLRRVAYGVLGPHAVSITYRSGSELVTRPVVPGSGAYLIVEPVTRPTLARRRFGGTLIGWTAGRQVALGPFDRLGGLVRAVTFRFGALVCSAGSGAPVKRRCSEPPPTPMRSWKPTHRLNLPVHAILRTQSHAECSAAFLLDPCYRAEISFKAPYGVTNAGAEYSVEAESTCGNARPSGWAVDRDIKRGETVRTLSTGLFNCTSIDRFQVLYRNNSLQGPTPASPHESSIVGVAIIDVRKP